MYTLGGRGFEEPNHSISKPPHFIQDHSIPAAAPKDGGERSGRVSNYGGRSVSVDQGDSREFVSGLFEQRAHQANSSESKQGELGEKNIVELKKNHLSASAELVHDFTSHSIPFAESPAISAGEENFWSSLPPPPDEILLSSSPASTEEEGFWSSLPPPPEEMLVSSSPNINEAFNAVQIPLPSRQLQEISETVENQCRQQRLNLPPEAMNALKEQIALSLLPVVDKYPLYQLVQGIFTTALSDAIRVSRDNPSLPLAFDASTRCPFIELMQAINPESKYGNDIILWVCNPESQGSRNGQIEEALKKFTPGMSDLDQARIAYSLFRSSPSLSSTELKEARAATDLNRSLTQSFDRAVGSEFRKGIPEGGVFVYSQILSDGIGDLIHLVNLEKAISSSFGNKVSYAALEQLPGSQQENAKLQKLHHDIVRQAGSKIAVEDTSHNLYADKYSTSLKVQVRAAEMLYCISQQRDFIKTGLKTINPNLQHLEVPTLQEIQLPDLDGMNAPLDIMGVQPGNAGVWISNAPPPIQQSLKNCSANLKGMLGCSGLNEQELAAWYGGSQICTSMLYNADEVSKAIYASLALLQSSGTAKERLIFKTKIGPDFLTKPLRPEIIRELEQLGVGTVVVDNEKIFSGTKPGVELRILTKRIEEEDWKTFKDLVNGVSGVGGDNTLSEALSNPNTLPPLIFSQHQYKHDAYCGIIDLARELPDELIGKKELVEYMEAVKEMAYWATPMDYASKLANILEKAGDKAMRNAWSELTQYARKKVNLNEFVVAQFTEQLFLEKFPEISKERERIMNSHATLEEKSAEYVKLAKEAIEN